MKLDCLMFIKYFYFSFFINFQNEFIILLLPFTDDIKRLHNSVITLLDQSEVYSDKS